MTFSFSRSVALVSLKGPPSRIHGCCVAHSKCAVRFARRNSRASGRSNASTATSGIGWPAPDICSRCRTRSRLW